MVETPCPHLFCLTWPARARPGVCACNANAFPAHQFILMGKLIAARPHLITRLITCLGKRDVAVASVLAKSRGDLRFARRCKGFPMDKIKTPDGLEVHQRGVSSTRFESSVTLRGSSSNSFRKLRPFISVGAPDAASAGTGVVVVNEPAVSRRGRQGSVAVGHGREVVYRVGRGRLHVRPE